MHLYFDYIILMIQLLILKHLTEIHNLGDSILETYALFLFL